MKKNLCVSFNLAQPRQMGGDTQNWGTGGKWEMKGEPRTGHSYTEKLLGGKKPKEKDDKSMNK